MDQSECRDWGRRRQWKWTFFFEMNKRKWMFCSSSAAILSAIYSRLINPLLYDLFRLVNSNSVRGQSEVWIELVLSIAGSRPAQLYILARMPRWPASVAWNKKKKAFMPRIGYRIHSVASEVWCCHVNGKFVGNWWWTGSIGDECFNLTRAGGVPRIGLV